MQSSINYYVKICTFLEKLIKILIFSLFSEAHSLFLVFTYSEQWRMICTAVFCAWSHLHWEEEKSRICILLRKAARSIWFVHICIRIILSVFLRSLCVFKILWWCIHSHKILLIWFVISSFFSSMLHCLLQTYFTDVFRWHESLISSSDLLFFCS